MPQEPQELAANEWGAITYPQWDTLELAWGPQTRSMTDDGFKQTLQIMADHGLKVRPKRMIIDATQFSHTLGEGTLAWRDERIAPLYNDAGVEKFAFLTTASMPGTVEKGAEPPLPGVLPIAARRAGAAGARSGRPPNRGWAGDWTSALIRNPAAS